MKIQAIDFTAVPFGAMIGVLVFSRINGLVWTITDQSTNTLPIMGPIGLLMIAGIIFGAWKTSGWIRIALLATVAGILYEFTAVPMGL